MSNQKLTEVKKTEAIDDIIEVATLGFVSAPVSTTYVVENTDTGSKNEFASQSAAIKFMSSTDCKC